MKSFLSLEVLPSSEEITLKILALSLALLLLAPLPSTAQSYTEVTDVVVVEVPVQVVRDGKPVRGLKAEDFEVYEGRRKQTLTGFEVVDLASVTTAATPGQPVPAQAVPPSGRRHFLMLFDLSFAEPKSVLLSRRAAADVVADLHPSDLVAVATYSNLKGPELVLGFTADRRQIAAAVDTLGSQELLGRPPDPLRLVLTGGEEKDVPSTTQPSGEGPGGDAAAAEEVLGDIAGQANYAHITDMRVAVRNLTANFGALARMMGSIDGRKYVVYLSEGFEGRILTGATSQSEREEAAASAFGGGGMSTSSETMYGSSEALNDLAKMVEEFRRADCAIQAVDIGGLRGAGNLGGRRASGKETLLSMAKDTGGEFYENYNDLSVAMGQMLEKTSVTYVLSFQPEKIERDGSFHRLRVELKGQPGARVIHRPGYYAPKPFAQQQVMEKTLNAGESLMTGEEAGTIRTAILAAPFRGTADRAYVPVLVEVDGPTLVDGLQGNALPAELYVYALDAQGTVRDYVAQTMGLDLAKVGETVRKTGLKFFGHLDLAPGDYSLRILVRNGSTGAVSLRAVPVQVPAFADGQAVLLPPLFPEPAGKWLIAREAPTRWKQDMPYPFLLREQPYIPAALPVLAPGAEAELTLVTYNLTGALQAKTRVLAADGRELGKGQLRLIGRESSAPERLLVAFRPPQLAPGEYRLEITLTDGGGTTRTSSAPFVVGKG